MSAHPLKVWNEINDVHQKRTQAFFMKDQLELAEVAYSKI